MNIISIKDKGFRIESQVETQSRIDLISLVKSHNSKIDNHDDLTPREKKLIKNLSANKGMKDKLIELWMGDYIKIDKIIGQIKETRYKTKKHENAPSSKTYPFIAYLLMVKKDVSSVRVISDVIERQDEDHNHIFKRGKSNCHLIPRTPMDFYNMSGAFAILNGGFFTKEKCPLNGLIVEGRVIQALNNPARPFIYIEENKNEKQLNIGEKVEILTEESISKDVLNNSSGLKQNISILQAGPLLIKDNDIITDYTDFKKRKNEFNSDITKARHPRSLFGYNRDYNFFISIEGRSKRSAGMYLEECAEFGSLLNISNLMNLDGGASSSLVINGVLLNTPRIALFKNRNIFSMSLPGQMRKIPDALGIFIKD
ncbi:MAG: phosphodiester glycosidase family protein [Promethearchaeota archaeon]